MASPRYGDSGRRLTDCTPSGNWLLQPSLVTVSALGAALLKEARTNGFSECAWKCWQVVVVAAGYDTRAYRLKQGSTTVRHWSPLALLGTSIILHLWAL